MSTVKKTAAHNNHGRKFPPEAYEWDDDVTKEAVDKVREEVRPLIETAEWELIDGFVRCATRLMVHAAAGGSRNRHLSLPRIQA